MALELLVYASSWSFFQIFPSKLCRDVEVVTAAAEWLWRTSHSGQMIMILHNRYTKYIWISKSKNFQLNIAQVRT